MSTALKALRALKAPKLAQLIPALASALILTSLAAPAHAYIGPGITGGSLIFLALLGLSVFLALYALVWYPIKRRLKGKPKTDEAQPDEAQPDESEGSGEG